MSQGNVIPEFTKKFGMGEMLLEVSHIPQYETSLGTIIASEVVSDLIDKALDIALNKPDENKENTIQSKCISSKVEETQEIFKNSREYHECNNDVPKSEQPNDLKTEIGKLLTEMITAPPYSVINYDLLPRKDGIGDQAFILSNDEEVYQDSNIHRIVEKKSRATDLVMHSKEKLSEYFLNEEERRKQCEWEINNEQIIQVLQLDCVQPGDGTKITLQDGTFATAFRQIRPEDIPLPPDDPKEEGGSSKAEEYENIVYQGEFVRGIDENSIRENPQDKISKNKNVYDANLENRILAVSKDKTHKKNIVDDEEEEVMLPLPNDTVMDSIDLSVRAFREEERMLCDSSASCFRKKDANGGKGDDGVPRVHIQTPELTDINIIHLNPLNKRFNDNSGSSKKSGKKKKWNFGQRVMNFFKKKQRDKGESTSAAATGFE